MIVWDIFREFIFSKRAGSLVRSIAKLSIISISVSVTAFLIVLFVMNGMNDSIIHRILAMEPHAVVTQNGEVVSDKKGTQKFEQVMAEHPFQKWLKEHSDYKSYVFENQEVILRTLDGQFRGAIAKGLGLPSLENINYQIRKMESLKTKGVGGFYWDPSEIPAEGEIAIGYDLARSLGVFEGDFLTVISPEGLLLPPGEIPKFEKVKVRKIITTSLADWDSQYIFYQRGKALESLRKSLSRKEGLEVYAPNGYDLGALKKELATFSDLKFETWEDRNSAMFFALKMEKFFIGLFLGLAGLIASSSVLTVLVLLLSEKRSDIAILRTLGLSSRKTIRLFTQVGTLLSATGIVVGVLIGTSLGLYIEAHPLDLLPDIYYDSQIPAKVEWSLVVLVIFFGGVIAIMGSYWPAKEASEVNPTESLRR